MGTFNSMKAAVVEFFTSDAQSEYDAAVDPVEKQDAANRNTGLNFFYHHFVANLSSGLASAATGALHAALHPFETGQKLADGVYIVFSDPGRVGAAAYLSYEEYSKLTVTQQNDLLMKYGGSAVVLMAAGGILGEVAEARAAAAAAENAELVAARQQLLGQLRELARRRSLGVDPASGRYRLAEEQAALRLEQQIGRQVTRDPSGTGDWLDAAGRTYDAVGPVPAGRFDLASFTRQIGKHLLKQGLDKVVVDVTGLSEAEVAAVMSHIKSLTSAEQARIIVQ